MTARTFGIAAAMRLKTERDLLAQYQRAPGLPSSNIGLETVLGLDETIEFEDILNGLPYLPCFFSSPRCDFINVYYLDNFFLDD